MFYLIGVNHDVQRHAPGAEFDAHQVELERCLSAAIEKCRPALIAVEESEDTLKDKRKGVCVVYESIPRNFARRHAIEPMLCEPSDDWKAQHGCMDSLTLHLELSVSDLLRGIPSNQKRRPPSPPSAWLCFSLFAKSTGWTSSRITFSPMSFSSLGTTTSTVSAVACRPWVFR